MNAKKINDHRRIAWRLSGRIAASQISAFIAIDVFLLFLILVYRADTSTLDRFYSLNVNLSETIGWMRGIPYLDIGSFWVLASVCVIEILLIINQTARMRRHIREQLEPLRELRVAADAFADAADKDGTGVSAEALRRMTDALRHVQARDMDTHIAAESLSPELRPLLDAIKDMLDRLESAYAAQNKFVSDASHELRTPIAVIQGYANLLSRWGSEDPETLKESIEAIRSEAESMKQMVNQLLFLARGDSDTLKVDMQPTDIVSIAAEVLREALMLDEAYAEQGEVDGGAQAEHKPHEIVSRVPDSPVIVSADPALIKQLIRILVDNSLKYTPAGCAIMVSVSAQPEAGRASVTVQDEGQGIPADILPHIFDRFVRADEARTRNTGGAGLGLSIAKQIAERHGGALEASSFEGIGSRFTVSLPLLQSRDILRLG